MTLNRTKQSCVKIPFWYQSNILPKFSKVKPHFINARQDGKTYAHNIRTRHWRKVRGRAQTLSRVNTIRSCIAFGLEVTWLESVKCPYPRVLRQNRKYISTPLPIRQRSIKCEPLQNVRDGRVCQRSHACITTCCRLPLAA